MTKNMATGQSILMSALFVSDILLLFIQPRKCCGSAAESEKLYKKGSGLATPPGKIKKWHSAIFLSVVLKTVIW